MLFHVIFQCFGDLQGSQLTFLGRSPISANARARAFNARARVGANRPEDLDPKTGGSTPGSHNGELLRAQTDQPDPQLIENKRDEKKTYEILWLFNMKKMSKWF